MNIHSFFWYCSWRFSLFCYRIVVIHLRFDHVRGHLRKVKSPSEDRSLVVQLNEDLCFCSFIKFSSGNLYTAQRIKLISNSPHIWSHSPYNSLLFFLCWNFPFFEDDLLLDFRQKLIPNCDCQNVGIFFCFGQLCRNDLRVGILNGGDDCLIVDFF